MSWQSFFNLPVNLDLPYLSFQSLTVNYWIVVKEYRRGKVERSTIIIENISFFILQPAHCSTQRAWWLIVHLTVVKATCVTRLQSQQHNLNQQMMPLDWLQALEPFCLFFSSVFLLNPVSIFRFVSCRVKTAVFRLSLDVCVYLIRNTSFYF